MAIKPRRKINVRRGDAVYVYWWDTCEDPVGNPDSAQIALRKTIGTIWGIGEQEGQKVLVTTGTIDRDVSHQQGWCAYPMGCVDRIEIIKKAGK